MKLPAGIDLDVAQNALAEVIRDHVPHLTQCEYTDDDFAQIILLRWGVEWHSPRVLAKKAERQKLKDIRKKVREISALWKDLDSDIRHRFEDSIGLEPFFGKSGSSHVSGFHLLSFLDFGPEIVEKALPAVEALITESQPIGRRKYPEIRIVSACSDVWARLTGEVPRSHGHAGFRSFVAACFIAVHVDASAENVIRSWSELMED